MRHPFRVLPILGAFLLVSALFGAAVPAAVGQQATATPTPVQRSGGRFEENDPLLIYAGTWTTVTEARASGGALRRSAQEGATVQLTFPGPNVRWITTRGPDRGIARVFVNDEDKGTVDLYAAAEQFGVEFSYGGLDETKSHTIVLEVTGQRSGAATGSNVDLDSFIAVGAVAPEPLRFENTDPAVFYDRRWDLTPAARASGGSVHRSDQPNATSSLRFSGPSVTWITSRGPTRGIAEVYIDDRLVDPVDLFAAAEQFGVEQTYTGLAAGDHVIRIEATGRRSGGSSQSGVDVDAFVVFGAPVAPAPTPTAAAATPTATATVPAAVATATVAAATAVPQPTAGPIPPAPPGVRDQRYFIQTNFRVDNDQFWDYFNARGGVSTFGFPISRTFTFIGCTTQFFQRQLMQQCPGTGVRTMNLLDPELMPYNQINFSSFPAHDPNVAGAAPAPGTPNYGSAVLGHIRSVAPDTFQNLPVRYFTTFVSTVPGSDPQRDPDFAALVNLEVWGFPTSGPAFDPANGDFVYQRFQRGIMHFRASTGTTEGILLADYFKSIITGRNLPPDLAAQAAGSPYVAQYCPGAPNWICRPVQLRDTDLTFAFEPQ